MISYSEFMALESIEVGELITISTPSFDIEVTISVFHDNLPAKVKVSLSMDSAIFKYTVGDSFDNLAEAKAYIEQQLAYCYNYSLNGDVLNKAILEKHKDELIVGSWGTFEELREHVHNPHMGLSEKLSIAN